MNSQYVLRPIPESSDDRFVLHGRDLRVGYQLEETARFDDDVWPMAPASLQTQERGLTLRFLTVPPQHRVTLKRLCYAMLSGPSPDDGPRPRVSSVATAFYSFRTFLKWLDENHPTVGLPGVNLPLLEQYQLHLLTEYRASTRRYALRSAVNIAWRYRESLAGEGLPQDPRDLPAWSEPDRSANRENSTARVPESVQSRVLVWALRFVDDFSDDIVDAIDAWIDRRRPQVSRTASGKPWGYQQQRIKSYLDTARDLERPLPGRLGVPSFNAIAYQIGCDRTALERHRERVITTAAMVGVSEHIELGLTIKGQIDGMPWLDGVTLSPGQEDSLTVLTQVLHAACYIVIAFLSGMRDNEIKHLQPGCCTVALDTSGRPYRWTVNSLAFKGEADDHGTPATWVVGNAAARAIHVLERAHEAIKTQKSEWLFTPFKVGPGAGSAGRGGNHALTLAGTNRHLGRFTSWVNDYCASRGRKDGIPDVDGRPWRLSSRQFRRTLAWYIARRPGGSIAGAIAYRHHSIRMFEGYAGTSASGFRAEVEAEEALARGEQLLAMIDQHDHTELLGTAAVDGTQRLETLAENAKFRGVVSTDRQRLLRLMKRHDPAIYPGQYVTCVYDHRKALCRTRSSTSGDLPDITTCQPLACGNVALTGDNLTAWRAELSAIEADRAARPSLPPLLDADLKTRSARIMKLISRAEAELQ